MCKKERLGLQSNQSCFCACSLNLLSVKTQFVWELKETGELLKLAEASLIENQQTTETPQYTHSPLLYPQGTILTIATREECWLLMLSKAGGFHCLQLQMDCCSLSNIRLYAAFTIAHYSWRKKKIIPPGSQHLQLVVWTQLKSQTRFMKSCCCLVLSNLLKIHSDGISVLLDKQWAENKMREWSCNPAL